MNINRIHAFDIFKYGFLKILWQNLCSIKYLLFKIGSIFNTQNNLEETDTSG